VLDELGGEPLPGGELGEALEGRALGARLARRLHEGGDVGGEALAVQRGEGGGFGGHGAQDALKARAPSADGRPVTSPAVTCLDCGFAWRSRAMADGLRVVGRCPKCSGSLRFAEPAAAAPERAAEPAPAPRRADAPHLVLGVPRRR